MNYFYQQNYWHWNPSDDYASAGEFVEIGEEKIKDREQQC